MTNLIVKDNVLVQASHRLGEAEQRLILLAIVQARKNSQTIDELTGKEMAIHADDYIDNFGGSRQNAYKVLKQAVMGLFDAKWGYKHLNEKGNLVVSHRRFTQSADYIENEATVKFMFANAIVPFLMELQNKFTQYDIKQVANLSSAYALRLYEYFLSYLHKHSNHAYFEVSLEDLRFTLGLLHDEYPLMSDFKKRVLDLSVKQINKNTDISVTYTQKKQGRKIVGFKFELQRKTPKSESNIKDADIDALFVGLTSPEIDAIKEAVQKTIEKNDVTDPKHIQNLYKKAIKDGWGLDDTNPPPSDDLFSAENDKKRKKVQQKHELKLKQQQEEHDRLVALYEQGDDAFKSLVADKMRQQLKDTNKSGMIVHLNNKIKLGQSYHTDNHLKSDFMSVMLELKSM